MPEGSPVHSMPRSRSASNLVRGSERLLQTAYYARLPQRHHRIEERRSNGLANDGDSRGVNQQPGLHTGGFGDGARSMVAGVMIPCGQRGKSVRQFSEQLWDFRIFPELFFRRWINGKIIAEEGPRQ